MRTGRRLAAGLVALGVSAFVPLALAQDPVADPVAGSSASADPTLAPETGTGALSFSAIRDNALRALEAAAAAEDPAAAIVLARHLLRPEATAAERAMGVEYLELAAAFDLDEARVWLGDIYRDGLDGFEPDFDRAAAHYDVAAAHGDNTARRHYAAMLLVRNGAGDTGQALALFAEAAADGDIPAAIALADIYAEGLLVPRDGQKAMALYQLGLVAANLDAITGLADLYRAGTPDLPADPVQAVVLYEQAAALGDRPARQKLAEMHIRGEGVAADVEKGIALLEELAALGQASALVDLGDLFAAGEYIAADGARAADYYERAAEIGDFSSLVRVADLYRHGTEGFPPDIAAAVPFYEEAVDEGSNDARRALAEILLEGAPEVPADKTRALQLLRTAAEAGDAQAAAMLAGLGEAD